MAHASGRLAARYTSEFLCGRIFERHAASIRVKKPHVAVANLVRIVEAFLTLSNRKGFHATSLRDLAGATGLSMGGLYSYFDSKNTLLMMILGEVEATMREVLEAVPTAVSHDPAAHLRWVIAAHIWLTETMHPWFVFAYMEAKSFPVSARRAAVDSEMLAENMIAEILERGRAAGVFGLDDVALAAALTKPLLQDWYVKRSKYRKRGIGCERYVEEVTRFVEAAAILRADRHGSSAIA